MIPCLYDSTETAFTTNGIGKLTDCISCVVTEKRNGSYELKMEYPADGIHADDLVEDNIILAKPADNKAAQPFRIYKTVTDLSGTMDVEARHISYQMSYITVSPVTIDSGDADTQLTAVWDGLVAAATTDVPFTFESDIESERGLTVSEPMSLRSILGGVDGSMLDTFGGEFEWDFNTVKLLSSRGTDNGVRIVYGKNLAGFSKDESNENVLTGIHPFYKDAGTGEITELPEKILLVGDADEPFERINALDLSEAFDETPTEDELRECAQAYLDSTTLTEPSIDITISFVPLWQYPEYEDIAEAEHVSLCDTVHVYILRMNLEVSATVTETEFDALLERYNSITLSNAMVTSQNKSLANTISGMSGASSSSASWMSAYLKYS